MRGAEFSAPDMCPLLILSLNKLLHHRGIVITISQFAYHFLIETGISISLVLDYQHPAGNSPEALPPKLH